MQVVLVQNPAIPESRPQELVPSAHAFRQGWPGMVHKLGGGMSARAKFDAPTTMSKDKNAADRVLKTIPLGVMGCRRGMHEANQGALRGVMPRRRSADARRGLSRMAP